MHEQSRVGDFLNQHVFDPLARALGIAVAPGHHAVPDHIVMILLVSSGLVLFSLWARRSFSVEAPSRTQQLLEVVLEAIQGLMKQVIGKDTDRFVPLIGALAVYILTGNVL